MQEVFWDINTNFIEIFTKIAFPLFKLLIKDVEFSKNIDCHITFNILKEKLSIARVLRGLDWTLPFHISMDASDSVVGKFLGQHIPFISLRP